MFIISLLLAIKLLSSSYYEDGKKCAERVNHLIETKKELKQKISIIKSSKSSKENEGAYPETTKNKCSSLNYTDQENQIPCYVFISFSIPNQALISLSKEVEKFGGVMVLRGLPENSFKNLAVQIYELRKQGANATIQINPKLFSKFSVETVPCFVVESEEGFDKLSGNVSLAFALEKIKHTNAKNLRKSL